MSNNSIMTTIKPSQLTVDRSVQRALDTVRVNKIVSEFSRDAIGVIHVSERKDGTWHIIDGQHRVAAIQAINEAEIPVACVLWQDLTNADEAAIFRKLNNTRGVHALDKFRVRVVEGDRVACKLNELLKQHGWTVRTGRVVESGSFAAVSALEKVYLAKEDGDPDTVEKLIEVATAAWGHDSNGLRAELVTGLGALLRRHRDLDQAKLVSEMAKHQGGALGLVGQAKQLNSIRGGKISDAMAEILINLYNKRRATNKLPDWRSG